PGAPATEPHAHAGAEMIYVIAGRLELNIHGRSELLEAGDSLYFDPSFDHVYRGGGEEHCRVIVVVTPETTE
ncbi:MAG: cupin domain-containing protein, partial [Thalassovita sp.]|nr:cupin domain-containing protein [Thalassovita sp.]